MFLVTMHRQFSFNFNLCSGTPGDLREFRNSVDMRFCILVSSEHNQVTLNILPVQHRQDLSVEGIDNTVGSGDDSPLAALLNIIDVKKHTKLMASSSLMDTASSSKHMNFVAVVAVAVAWVAGSFPSLIRSTKLE